MSDEYLNLDSELDIDRARETPTASGGLKPPKSFADKPALDIDGAPDWMNKARRADHEERVELMEMMREVLRGQQVANQNDALILAELSAIRTRLAATDKDIDAVRVRATRAQETADRALSTAREALTLARQARDGD